jgi:hypothetical protein
VTDVHSNKTHILMCESENDPERGVTIC